MRFAMIVRTIPFALAGLLLLASASPAAAGVESLLQPASGSVLFVSKANGSNSNPGTREAPLANIDRAISRAAAGDTILVAEGVYNGTFDIGFLESDKPLRLYGGFAPDFSSRDPQAHPTRIQPDNASAAKSRKALLTFTRQIDGVVVDGFVFDMGQRNAYHAVEGKPAGVESGRLLLPPERSGGDNPTVTEPCLAIPSAAAGGDLLIQNNVFVNCAKFAIQAGLRSGNLRILDNVFVANRMAAIEAYGTCAGASGSGPGAAVSCGRVEIAGNVILFSWSRTKELKDMGYGVRVMTKLEYDIHDNLIGGNVLAGVDHSRFNPDRWLRLDRNTFFVNRKADVEYSPASNTTLDLRVEQLGDLEIASATGNRGEIPKGLAVDRAYLGGFLGAHYRETTDLDRNSPANQWRSALGLNLQGTMTSAVSMYGNRYPWQKALELLAATGGRNSGISRPGSSP
ncbi:MAG TPA: right-handed parallel beta-helix repeat-containing protein [Thermoanaerobaculia bacterium]|nr:right-handed parallel beta-helix repeat-containing protein [Thermoanaerobaculia bacterium]HQN97647.1 right-handed parallel beta-helix repeat-containing protein [Thermoanaerobaculales bacterium]HQP92870.1 right-handed parallel beta-helix repeat-containing protein [Thermoanaerobaculia bacterium]